MTKHVLETSHTREFLKELDKVVKCRNKNINGEMQCMTYEETLEDIKSTLGVIPVFMKTLPRDFLIREWPLFKIYNVEKKKILSKYRERISSATAASMRCPYCTLFNMVSSHMNDVTDDGFEEAIFLANYIDKSAIFSIQHNGCNEFKKEPENAREYLQKMIQN